MTLLIIIDYGASIVIYLTTDTSSVIIPLTDEWFPIAFCISNMVVIAVAVARVRAILRAEQTISLNEKYMGFYVGVLFLFVVTSCLSHY